MKITRGQLIVNFLCLIPAALLILALFQHKLTANPIQAVTLRTGRIAITLLLLSLGCTPLKNLLNLNALLLIRRTLGLYAYFYAVAHFLIFAGLDFEFNFTWIIEEIRQKAFMRVGLAALILLLPLAITSLPKLRSKMGYWWQRLQSLVYLIAVLEISHYLQATKEDKIIPLIYAGIFIVLMLFRLPPLSKITLSKKPQWLKDLNQFLLL